MHGSFRSLHSAQNITPLESYVARRALNTLSRSVSSCIARRHAFFRDVQSQHFPVDET